MTADSPASGLPQEAVDAVMRAIPTTRQWATLALTAALPFLREQWLLGHDCYGYLTETADLLAAERAKVAALQQAVDKVRALHRPYDHDSTLCRGCEQLHCRTVALLPDVQADDRGTTTPTPATTCADCGTTRTICDAGLNTYDTRCCEQCGHGEGK